MADDQQAYENRIMAMVKRVAKHQWCPYCNRDLMINKGKRTCDACGALVSHVALTNYNGKGTRSTGPK